MMNNLITTIRANLQALGVQSSIFSNWDGEGNTAIFPDCGMDTLHGRGVSTGALGIGYDGPAWWEWYSNGVILVGRA